MTDSRAASIVLTAQFEDQKIGVLRIDVDHLLWIPVDVRHTIANDQLPCGLLTLQISTEKGTADLLRFSEAIPFNSFRWRPDDR